MINDLNPNFMKSIFSAKLNARVRPNDILLKAQKSTTFGDKNLATLGLKIWNKSKTKCEIRKLLC